MGIQNFFKVFGKSGTETTLKKLSGNTLAVDASMEIYKACLGIKDVGGLTDASGNSTVHINVIVQQLGVFKKNGIELVYVFDNVNTTPLKLQELKKRDERREKEIKKKESRINNGKILELADSKSDKIIFKMTDEIVKDVQFILDCAGVPYITAPDGYEAEHLAAELTKRGLADYVLSSDSDVFMFGGSMIRKYNKTYTEFKLDKILSDFGLTQQQLINIGVALGCDFAQKRPGIGPKTVINPNKNESILDGSLLTDDQKIAAEYFASECPFEPEKAIISTKNLEKLEEWLIKKQFAESRVKTMIKKL